MITNFITATSRMVVKIPMFKFVRDFSYTTKTTRQIDAANASLGMSKKPRQSAQESEPGDGSSKIK